MIISDDGGLEVGPDEGDPLRQSNARFVQLLAHRLEMELQVNELLDEHIAETRRRLAQLEASVRLIEQLVIGEAA